MHEGSVSKENDLRVRMWHTCIRTVLCIRTPLIGIVISLTLTGKSVM